MWRGGGLRNIYINVIELRIDEKVGNHCPMALFYDIVYPGSGRSFTTHLKDFMRIKYEKF